MNYVAVAVVVMYNLSSNFAQYLLVIIQWYYYDGIDLYQCEMLAQNDDYLFGV